MASNEATFKKEKLKDRVQSKVQENVAEKFKRLEAEIKLLKDRVFKLENP